MKYSRKSYLITLLVVGIIIQYACSEKQEDISIEQESELVYIENNIVHFASMNAFTETVNYLNKIPRNELQKWENSIGFNNSMRKFYEELEEPDQAELIERWVTIPDPVLATIVNDQGVYCINDTIHKITYQYEYIITDGDYSKLVSLNNEVDLKSAENIITFPIERKTNNTNLKWVGWKSVEKSDICNFSNRRAQLKAWNVTLAAYASCGMRIVGRQKRKRCGFCKERWMDWYMDWAKVSGTARINYWIGGSSSGFFERSNSDSDSDKKNVDVILGWAAGTGAAVNCDWIYGDYYYEDGGCSKNWYQEFN